MSTTSVEYETELAPDRRSAFRFSTATIEYKMNVQDMCKTRQGPLSWAEEWERNLLTDGLSSVGRSSSLITETIAKWSGDDLSEKCRERLPSMSYWVPVSSIPRPAEMIIPRES